MTLQDTGPVAVEPPIAAGPVSASEARPPRRLRRQRRVHRRPTLSWRDRSWLILAVGIPTAVHVLLVWIPALLTAVLSFAQWDNLTPISELTFVGFQNYWQIFTIFDTQLFPALFNNLAVIVWLFACSAIGMLLAYLLDKNIRGSRFYQSVFYLPVVLSSAVVGFMWKSVMFHPDQGLLNKAIPGSGIDFLGDNSPIFEIGLPFLDFPLGISRNFAALLIAMSWRHIGYIMVLYLAGLKAVDPTLREAASIDGCNEWQAFRRVIFHALKPINVIVAVITMIEALRAYDIIAALGRQRGTEVIATLVVSSLTGEGGGRVGIGSAYGMILFVLCLGFIISYVTNNFRSDDS
jgi:multiple sugar transport system permease protein